MDQLITKLTDLVQAMTEQNQLLRQLAITNQLLIESIVSSSEDEMLGDMPSELRTLDDAPRDIVIPKCL